MSILAVGFNQEFHRPFVDAGLDIGGYIYSGQTAPTPHAPDVFIENEGIRFSWFEGAFDPDLDVEIANRVRAEALPLFFRTYVRAANRENVGAPEWTVFHNYFDNALNYYSKLLKERRFTRLLFWIIPHEGNFIILYHLARVMGIPTTTCFQSIYPNAFWMFEDTAEYGLSPITNERGVTIPFADQPELPFYVRGMYKPISRGKVAMTMAGHAADIGFRAATLQWLWRPYSMTKSVTKARRTWRKFEHQAFRDDAFARDITHENYIYFALHLQPELSADLIGGRFGDQMLAIEEIAREKPDDYAIYLKENPRQTSLMRGESFFARARAIPDVVLFRHYLSTHELNQRSRMVAAITGTAGYEALQFGKPVLCFGDAWYRGLPGVFDWRKNPRQAMKDALAFKYDREALKAALAEKCKRLWKGLIDPYYIENTPEYDPEANPKLVAENIAEYLEKVESRRRAA